MNFFWMKSSPTKSEGRFAPFTWATFPEMSREGMPMVYDFDWQKVPIDYELYLSSQKIKNL